MWPTCRATTTTAPWDLPRPPAFSAASWPQELLLPPTYTFRAAAEESLAVVPDRGPAVVGMDMADRLTGQTPQVAVVTLKGAAVLWPRETEETSFSLGFAPLPASAGQARWPTFTGTPKCGPHDPDRLWGWSLWCTSSKASRCALSKYGMSRAKMQLLSCVHWREREYLCWYVCVPVRSMHCVDA